MTAPVDTPDPGRDPDGNHIITQTLHQSQPQAICIDIFHSELSGIGPYDLGKRAERLCLNDGSFAMSFHRIGKHVDAA